MKDFTNINDFLLPPVFRKYGLLLIFGGIPAVLLFMTILVLNMQDPKTGEYWSEWGGYLLHIPISMGLFWMLFASEHEEDEMYLTLRLKAMFHGIKFIFVAILMLPLFSLASYSFGISDQLKAPDIGGNLAVVSLLLAYAYGSYWWLKRQFISDLQEDEE